MDKFQRQWENDLEEHTKAMRKRCDNLLKEQRERHESAKILHRFLVTVVLTFDIVLTVYVFFIK